MLFRSGGIFDALLTLVRRGLGGTAGDGRQFVSWIHFEDFVRATRWLIDHDEIVYRKCYGLADLETQRPITAESSFYLASIAKCPFRNYRVEQAAAG